MGLGAFHTVSLAEARPSGQRRASWCTTGLILSRREGQRLQQKLETARAMTFKQCADGYIETHRASWKNAKHADQWFATFNETKRGKLQFPAATQTINDLPVSAIDTGLVLKVLEPIWTKTPELASRIRGRIERVLDWATVRKMRQGDNPARWRGHLRKLLPARTKLSRGHHDALPYAEMPASGRASRASPAFRPARDSRSSRQPGRVRSSARSGLNSTWRRMWTVPAERMKAARVHRVPLSRRALAVLSSLPREGEFVFPGAKAGTPLSKMAMLELVRGMRGRRDGSRLQVDVPRLGGRADDLSRTRWSRSRSRTPSGTRPRPPIGAAT